MGCIVLVILPMVTTEAAGQRKRKQAPPPLQSGYPPERQRCSQRRSALSRTAPVSRHEAVAVDGSSREEWAELSVQDRHGGRRRTEAPCRGLRMQRWEDRRAAARRRSAVEKESGKNARGGRKGAISSLRAGGRKTGSRWSWVTEFANGCRSFENSFPKASNRRR